MEAGEAKKIQDSSIELLFLYTNTIIQEPLKKWMEHFILLMALKHTIDEKFNQTKFIFNNMTYKREWKSFE